jgi:hypothetical protein
MAKTHRLDAGADTVHWGYFDAKLPTVLTIDSGDTVGTGLRTEVRILVDPERRPKPNCQSGQAQI